MSADSDHQVINKALKKHVRLQDFRDFEDVVVNAGINAVVMTHTDFRSFDDAISKGVKLRALVKSNTRPYLSKVKSATVVRGSHLLRFRTSFSAPWVKYELLNSTLVLLRATPKAEVCAQTSL